MPSSSVIPQRHQEGEVIEEPRMVALERSRRAAERLWQEIGRVLRCPSEKLLIGG